MNPVHLHLLVNHIPIVGTFFGVAILLAGIIKSQEVLKSTGMVIFVAMALVTIPAYLSGEEAEDPVEEMEGISHDVIHEHEEAAETALWANIVLGVGALAGLIFRKRKPALFRTLSIILMVYGGIVFFLMAQTGNSGGQIRRPDLQQVSNSANENY